MKYTPGPHSYTHGTETWVLRSDGTPIAKVLSSRFDAALFSGAPELVEAASNLIEALLQRNSDFAEWDTVQALSEAILKAGGK